MKRLESFQSFMKSFSQTANESLYNASLDDLSKSDFIVSVGTALKSDNPNARYSFNNSLTVNKGAGLYFHPVGDPIIDGMGKNILSMAHKPLQEMGSIHLLYVQSLRSRGLNWIPLSGRL